MGVNCSLLKTKRFHWFVKYQTIVHVCVNQAVQ